MLPTGHSRPPASSRTAINVLIPNAITVIALCAGMTAIRFAIAGHWDKAVASVLIAAVCDGVDGRMARLLKGTSRFGAELDSLSDFISFGVAPAIIVYNWALRGAGEAGWAAAMIFTTCCGMRLARFNTSLDSHGKTTAPNFIGVPAPAGGLLVMLPVYVWLGPGINTGTLHWPGVAWTVLVALLMISRMPTFSLKQVRITSSSIPAALIGVASLAAGLVGYMWELLIIACLAYLVSIPVMLRRARKTGERTP